MTNNILTLLPYVGSKRTMIHQLYRYFPSHRTYLEPMVGSYVVVLNHPSIELYSIGRISKKQLPVIAVNDINTGMISLAKALIFDTEKIYKAMNNFITCQGLYDYLKDFKSSNYFEEAIQMLYLLSVSFGSKIVKNMTFGYNITTPIDHITLPSPQNMQKIIFRLRAMQFFNMDYWDFLNIFLGKMKQGFIYLDPPYYGTTSGSEYFASFNHEEFVTRIQNIKSSDAKWLLSYNDCDFVRKNFEGYEKVEIIKTYTVGGKPAGQKNNNNFKGKELLIANYPLNIKKVAKITSFV